MQTVLIEISDEGKVVVEAQGVRGAGCKALTAAIERAIGTVTEDVKKSEFFQQANAHEGNRAQHQQ